MPLLIVWKQYWLCRTGVAVQGPAITKGGSQQMRIIYAA